MYTLNEWRSIYVCMCVCMKVYLMRSNSYGEEIVFRVAASIANDFLAQRLRLRIGLQEHWGKVAFILLKQLLFAQSRYRRIRVWESSART